MAIYRCLDHSIITLRLTPRFHARHYFQYANKLTTVIERKTTIVKERPILKKVFHHHVNIFISTLDETTQTFWQAKPQGMMIQPHHQYINHCHLLLKKEIRPTIVEYFEQRMEEEKNFYRYHPSIAKKMALSYLREKEVKTVLEHVMPKLSKTRYVYHTQELRINHLSMLMEPIMEQIRTSSVLKQQMVASLEELKRQDDMMLTNKEVVLEKVELRQVINEVYKEIEKKLHYQQMRKGR